MKNQATTAAPRLTVKKERIVCLNVNQNGSKAGGRTFTVLSITRW